jgi:predicted 2-oxoglutarate/Fe(II)-dependent dioxygenase YbiX
LYDCKLKKIPPGGGFHHWHYESASYTSTGRVFVVQLYLNDDFEGGSTVFEHMEVKPETGKLIVFSNSKYLHYVTRVDKSERYVLSFWYKYPESNE